MNDPLEVQLRAAILTFISASVVAVIAAFIAAFLAVRRTKRETRWQAKYEAYNRILSSIEDMRFWAEETYIDSLALGSIGVAQLAAAGDRYHEAKRSLWSYVHVGALLICDAAQNRLEILLSAIASEEFRFHEDTGDDENFPSDLSAHCEKVRTLIATHLPFLIETAKMDLR